MRIDILTIFPEMFENVLDSSIIKRSIEKGIVNIYIHDIRNYTENKHRRVDDYAYGPGAGMVMTIQPIADLIEKLQAERHYDEIIYLAPDAPLYKQKMANILSTKQNLMLLCGRYKGIDQRIRDKYITQEICIGDYVLTGGELAAMIIVDSVIRLIPGVLSDETSALTDSFQDDMLSPPVYTRPANYKGMKVPDVLLSGDDAKIEEWRIEKAIEKTKILRPELRNNEDR